MAVVFVFTSRTDNFTTWDSAMVCARLDFYTWPRNEKARRLLDRWYGDGKAMWRGEVPSGRR